MLASHVLGVNYYKEYVCKYSIIYSPPLCTSLDLFLQGFATVVSYLVTYFCFCRSYRLKKIQERRFCQFSRWHRQPCFLPRSEVFVVGTEFPYIKIVTVPQVDCCTSCSLAALQGGISQRRLIGEEGKETTGE